MKWGIGGKGSAAHGPGGPALSFSTHTTALSLGRGGRTFVTAASSGAWLRRAGVTSGGRVDNARPEGRGGEVEVTSRNAEERRRGGIGNRDRGQEGEMARQQTGGVGGIVREETARQDPPRGRRAVQRHALVDSILAGGVRRDHPVRAVVEKYESEGREIPSVERVPERLNGDVLLLKRSERHVVETKGGEHWGRSNTTNLRLRNGEQTRVWPCTGGIVCMNEECWYKKETGKSALGGFVRGERGERKCAFCGHPGMSLGECGAKKFMVVGEEESLVVHVGEHNHDLGEAGVDAELLERYKVEAMRMGAEDPKLTPTRFVGLKVREALLKMGEEGNAEGDGAMERWVCVST